MPNSTYPEKVIIYDLCQFLIGKKLTPEGRGLRRPISIKLQDFSPVLKLDQIQNTEHLKKVKDLEYELEQLSYENIPETLTPLIEIGNKKNIFKNFSQNFRRNKEIILTYERSGIEKYIECLKVGDKIRSEGENYNRLIFAYQNRKGIFSYKNKQMEIRLNEKSKSIRLNVCLLMFGYPANYNQERIGEQIDIYSEYPNYQKGNKVHVEALTQLILLREDEENRNLLPHHDNFRQIRDAVRGINAAAKIKLGIENIFNYKDQEINIADEIVNLIIA